MKKLWNIFHLDKSDPMGEIGSVVPGVASEFSFPGNIVAIFHLHRRDERFFQEMK